MATSFDWSSIGLVVFDVDGTLYDQGRLRRLVAMDLGRHALGNLDITTVRVLARYRRVRERLAQDGVAGFEPLLVDGVAAALGVSSERVRAIVGDWIERRPLRHLPGCRYDGLTDLFASLRAQGKTIGVLSDYPAIDKLAALGLAADLVVSAHDREIGVQKPDPKGLRHLMAQAVAQPAATLMVGDRPDRDGLVARQVGAHILIRSRRPQPGWPTFARFDDPPFAGLAAARPS